MIYVFASIDISLVTAFVTSYVIFLCAGPLFNPILCSSLSYVLLCVCFVCLFVCLPVYFRCGVVLVFFFPLYLFSCIYRLSLSLCLSLFRFFFLSSQILHQLIRDYLLYYLPFLFLSIKSLTLIPFLLVLPPTLFSLSSFRTFPPTCLHVCRTVLSYSAPVSGVFTRHFSCCFFSFLLSSPQPLPLFFFFT